MAAAKKSTTAPTKLSREGDIVLGIRASIGAKVLSDREYCLGRGVAGLRANERLYQRYLWHWLTWSGPALAAKGKGATFPQVNRQDIAEMQVPLPPLPEQRRIASILDQVESLRADSLSALSLVVEAQSSLYPTPAASSIKWTLRQLGLTFESGKSVTGTLEKPGGGRVLKVSAVSGARFDPIESKPLPEGYRPPPAHRVSKGELLITRASGSVDLIGVSAFVDDDPNDLYLPDKLWRARLSPTSPLNLRFLHALFKRPEFRAHVRNVSSGASGVRNISQAKVLDFSISLPSPEDLQGFAHASEKAELAEVALSARGRLLDELFACLQHRAFNGEL
jgi:type I restriction enzyme S subunit